jgi:hypothetical protein
VQDVNFIDATVYGYFEIRGLTAEHPMFVNLLLLLFVYVSRSQV